MVWLRRAVALALIGGIALLGGVGWVGREVVPEEFTAKTVVVRPQGAEGLRVTEYVDFDTGTNRRRGYLRELPHTFGAPQDIAARSPNAPQTLTVDRFEQTTRILVGDPDITIRGRFRYVVEYTLPQAGLSTGLLQWDVIGVDEALPTRRMSVYVTGLQLADAICSKGGRRTGGGCDIAIDPAGYAAVTSLAPGEGLFVGGTITGYTAPPAVAEPSLPPQRTYGDGWLPAPVLGGTAAVGLLLTWWWSRRLGRNEVSGATVADMAYASGTGTQLLTDTELARLATIEVSPPRGLTPWEGTVLLREAIDDRAVEAWWAYAAAQGRVILSEENQHLVITNAPSAPPLTPDEESALRTLFSDGTNQFEVGGYDPRFASTWSMILTWQTATIGQRDWWRGGTPRANGGAPVWTAMAAILTAVALVSLAIAGLHNRLNASLTWLGSLPLLAVAVGVVSLLVGWTLWAALRPSRTATGSALALQTMSFRRFLAESEGHHVEEAWQRGALREYTAWAVALGEADTWRGAASAATVPVEAVSAMSLGSVLLDHRGSLVSAYTTPSASGGSGGGSFGTVGSGGGGGRSGSW